MAPMRNRIKHDPFFFGLILLFLWFGGFSFGVTFYFFRDPGVTARYDWLLPRRGRPVPVACRLMVRFLHHVNGRSGG